MNTNLKPSIAVSAEVGQEGEPYRYVAEARTRYEKTASTTELALCTRKSLHCSSYRRRFVIVRVFSCLIRAMEACVHRCYKKHAYEHTASILNTVTPLSPTTLCVSERKWAG